MSIVTQVEQRITVLLRTGQERTRARAKQRSRVRVLHEGLRDYIRSVSVEDLYQLSATDKRTVAGNLLLHKYTSAINNLAALSINVNAVTRNEINRNLQDWCYLLNGRNDPT